MIVDIGAVTRPELTADMPFKWRAWGLPWPPVSPGLSPGVCAHRGPDSVPAVPRSKPRVGLGGHFRKRPSSSPVLVQALSMNCWLTCPQQAVRRKVCCFIRTQRVLLCEHPSVCFCFFSSHPFQSSVQASHPQKASWWPWRGRGVHGSSSRHLLPPPTPCLSQSTRLWPSRSLGYYNHLMTPGSNTIFCRDKMQNKKILLKGHCVCAEGYHSCISGACSSQCGVMFISSRENAITCGWAGLHPVVQVLNSDQHLYQETPGTPAGRVQMSEHKPLWVLGKWCTICFLQGLSVSLSSWVVTVYMASCESLWDICDLYTIRSTQKYIIYSWHLFDKTRRWQKQWRELNNNSRE